MTQDRPASGLVRDLRRVLAIVALRLLALPAYASFSLAQWNVHLANRLRSAGREAPDVGRERFYRGLVLYLPERGAVGFVYRAPHNPDDLARTLYFLQYSLAPRRPLERSVQYALAIVTATLLAYATVYLITPYDLGWHLRTSVDRVVLQLLPSIIWIGFMIANGHRIGGSGTNAR